MTSHLESVCPQYATMPSKLIAPLADSPRAREGCGPGKVDAEKTVKSI